MATPVQEQIQITDDEVFRRKLLMDGEGMGDERRLTLLLKSFYNWCDSKGLSEEQIVSGYENLLASLSTCELLMVKSHRAQVANEAEIENYKQLEDEIGKNISEVKDTIVQKKLDLQQAKKIREHKQQYDALARIIAQQPDRKETEAKLKALNEEIESLAVSKMNLEKKLDKRHKELQVLLGAAYELQKFVEKNDDSCSDSD
ncbi:THO complex subunit 7 homolog [Parasteatoda tepidariorum]|uniref:THO complex subunit 7 homolog n=1 Tax=Parasteatoda tepidariorum TaxID=114398 RepID=UPI00077FB418|nr:THO complex subunit 7 homolog [Parasteatoda tepidariorum]